MRSDTFILGGHRWHVSLVPSHSPLLVERTGRLTVATTDPAERLVCLSEELRGGFLLRVLIHELTHAAMAEFGLAGELRRMVRPGFEVEAEEWACNLLADYGMAVFNAAAEVLGGSAWKAVPAEFERMLAA